MRDQMTSNREAELTAIPRIGSGDLLGINNDNQMKLWTKTKN